MADYEQILETWFKQVEGSERQVVIAGKFFGGRWGEVSQVPRSYSLTKDGFEICFADTEKLTVVRPTKATLGGGDLLIDDAFEVRWGYYKYDMPETEESWSCRTFRRAGTEVEQRGTGHGPINHKWVRPVYMIPFSGGPLVKISKW